MSKYQAYETYVTYEENGKQITVDTEEIHENKLYETSHGVYFRCMEVYYNLMSHEQIRYNLFTIKDHKAV